MYTRGMSTREIVGHLRDLYGIEVSPDLISAVTDAVLEEVAAWQARPLEAVYPLIFFDALRVKIRAEGLVRNKAVHIALGVRADGTKEILGLWLEQNEGAKFWLRIMNELKNRGVEDVLIAVVDGLKGFPGAPSALDPSLHPDLRLLAQRGRELLLQDDPPAHPPRHPRSIADLQAAINAYLAEHNANPKPLVWAKTADAVLATLDRLTVLSVRV